MSNAVLFLVIGGAFIFSSVMTLIVIRLIRSTEKAEVPERVNNHATELRRRAAKLNTGTDDIEQRARRLEQMLSVKKEGK